ncbi:hypothetical protein T4E_7731 [Trichinella pseudospiralis]|uniref:Uncharacterized protein n=1 Tax=Trichinella pseudospiralis TaxID=6337 RepID=A0A0V0Y6L6_TRIPS|nr:hypothetical protein T4E_7731 [Trichinella pseudospiralis]
MPHPLQKALPSIKPSGIDKFLFLTCCILVGDPPCSYSDYPSDESRRKKSSGKPVSKTGLTGLRSRQTGKAGSFILCITGTVVNRTVITFHKDCYCDELKQLVSINVRPLTVICVELTCNPSPKLDTWGYFPTWGQDQYIMYSETTGLFLNFVRENEDGPCDQDVGRVFLLVVESRGLIG